MQVTLMPETERMAKEAVAKGDYPSIDDLVNAAVRQYFDIDNCDPYPPEVMRQLLAPEIEEADRGEFSTKTIDEIIAEARRLRDSRGVRK